MKNHRENDQFVGSLVGISFIAFVLRKKYTVIIHLLIFIFASHLMSVFFYYFSLLISDG